MLLLHLVLCLGVVTRGPASAPPPDRAGRPAQPQPQPLERAELDVEGLPLPALLEAIRLRAPQVAWTSFGAAAADDAGPRTPDDDSLAAVVRLVRLDHRRVALTIVVSDGRAYDREIDIEGIEDAERTRLLANNVANLVAGVDAGTVAADRSDVPMPEPSSACPPCPATPPCPEPSPPRRPDLQNPRPDPVVQVAVVGQLPVLIGLGQPRDADRFAGWGGTLGGWLRVRNGALVALEARATGRASVGRVGVVRGRFSLGGGYAWRRGSFGISALALVGAEPWSVRHRGRRARFEGEPARRVLLAAELRLAPAALLSMRRRSRTVEIGPSWGLSLSGSPGDGLAVPRVVLPGVDASRIRVGGIEMSLGAYVAVWFDGRQH